MLIPLYMGHLVTFPRKRYAQVAHAASLLHQVILKPRWNFRWLRSTKLLTQTGKGGKFNIYQPKSEDALQGAEQTNKNPKGHGCGILEAVSYVGKRDRVFNLGCQKNKRGDPFTCYLARLFSPGSWPKVVGCCFFLVNSLQECR